MSYVGADDLRAAALALTGAYEDFPFGPETSVFKVKAPSSGGTQRAGKVFALGDLDAEPMRISYKCDPELAPALRQANPGITAGYHLNKRHWNTVDTSVVEQQMVLEMLEDSYDLVVSGLPKYQQVALEWSAYVAKS
ncbi:MmcQ/YjbR family DNA-binding protein [Arthrobacter sp. N199823]|uniref:MmcQ/YjbR family DNA-binding protein n=1 Tax=Arthrobacter sp. N199823 TaxID=2058895 RepID=UPI000CE4F4D1|nr:MmcQ/YjbR family DNA-binding protein [Arthrobacter sp. N199823]